MAWPASNNNRSKTTANRAVKKPCPQTATQLVGRSPETRHAKRRLRVGTEGCHGFISGVRRGRFDWSRCVRWYASRHTVVARQRGNRGVIYFGWYQNSTPHTMRDAGFVLLRGRVGHGGRRKRDSGGRAPFTGGNDLPETQAARRMTVVDESARRILLPRVAARVGRLDGADTGPFSRRNTEAKWAAETGRPVMVGVHTAR